MLSNLSDPFSIQTYTKIDSVNGKTTTTSYDPSTQTQTITSPLGRTITSILDSNEKVVSNQMGSLNPITYSYDTRGRVSSVSQGGGRVTTMTYHPSSGLASSIKNALNQVTAYSYDGAGRITKKTLPDSREINFTYDWNGNLTSITPPGRPAHDMTYTGDNKFSGYLPPTILAPNPTATTYIYNDDRDLVQINRPDGQIIQYGYDNDSGRLTSITLPTGNRSFNYSNGKNYSSISEDFYQKNSTYSGNYLTNESMNGPSLYYWLQYSYDTDFKLISENLSWDIVSFQYDNDGNVTNAGDLLISRSSSTGFVDGTELGNIYQTFTYSATFGELSIIEAEYNNGNVYSENMTRDLLGRISSRTEQYGVTTPNAYEYTYDLSGRLTEVKTNGLVTSEFGYDQNSNRTSQTVNGLTLSGSSIIYDDQDRLVQFGVRNFTYNANGEVTSVTDSSTSQTISYNYDVLGNLRSVILPAKTINYIVDTDNLRLVKKNGANVVESYAWNKNRQLIAVLNPSGSVISRFVYGTKSNVPDYMIQGTDKYQIVSNHLGSPVVVIHSATGTIVQEIKYDEFGNVVSDSSPGFMPFGFAGCLYDHETNLCRFGARDYDASIGRWMSKDPIGFKGASTNLFGYVQNDPINLIDPSGEWPIPPVACLPYIGENCPKTYRKCLFSSGMIVDPEEQIEYSAECEEEKEKKDEKKVDNCSPISNVGLGGGFGKGIGNIKPGELK